MLVAFTLGFDERFAVRALIRHGVQRDDKIVAIIPRYRVDERTENALRALNEFAKRYLLSEQIERLEVDVADFGPAVVSLVKAFRSWTARPIVLSLSGGMRILIIETLLAAIVSDVEMKIEVESEDGATLTVFDNSIFNIALLGILDDVEKNVIRYLVRGDMAIDTLAELLEAAKSTVWRRIRRLISLGLVEVLERKGKGRKMVVGLTENGRLLSGVLE
ncbi:MAG: CRISPR-associated CARF protein Csa3 [Nitrososphaerota archaeon]|nr:CRISPR-associated CARF protein Csa3 [Nitrososphaerota archaeon]